jgi:erythromycin esterase-like protein
LLRLNDYILGKSDGKKRAMSDLQFSLWHVNAINDFFEGLRQYNLRQAEDSRIKIVGIDFHPNENDETSVQNLFKGNDNSESANIADIFDSKWLKIIQKILARKGSTEDVKQLDAPIEKAQALLKKTPNNQNAWLVLHGRLQYLDLYRKPFPQNFSLRDQVLAERIHWLEQNTPQNQTLLFLAHNVHISKASTGYLAERTGWYLNKSYPNRYAAIAGTFGKGDFTAIVSGGGARLKNFTTSDAPAETLEYYLSQFKTQAGYLLQLKKLANPSWLSQPIKMRSIPADSNIEVMKQQFELVNPVKEFDYILYLNEQTASD